jgi:GNAT superfamily N-acetyltransferase
MVAAWRDRVRHIEGHSLVEMNGLLLALTNLPSDELNVAIVAHRPDDSLEALSVAEQWFRWHGRRFGIEIELGRHPDMDRAVSVMGLDLAVERPAMAVAIADAASPSVPHGVEIRRVRTPEDLRAAVEVDVAAFDMPPEVDERFLGPSILEVPATRLYLAELEGEPVGCASTHLHEGAVGVFGVGVLERARRRGIGTAITAFALGDVRARADLAWLHPSEVGIPVYQAMGFRPVSDWAVHVRGDLVP